METTNNIEQLKENIREYIRQNGNKEITGQILQEVLLGMVDEYPDLAPVVQGLLNKVDKIEGKGLSTEDFTSELLQKLNSLKEVEANPTGEATTHLSTIKIEETTYKTGNPFAGGVDANDAERIQALANVSNQKAGYDDSTPPVFTGKMGYVVLQPETDDKTTFASQIANKPNTIFEIKDVFDLDPNSAIKRSDRKTQLQDSVVFEDYRYYYDSNEVVTIEPTKSPTQKMITLCKGESRLIKITDNAVSVLSNGNEVEDGYYYYAHRVKATVSYTISENSDISVDSNDTVTINDEEYFYSSEIELADGETIKYSGDFILVDENNTVYDSGYKNETGESIALHFCAPKQAPTSNIIVSPLYELPTNCTFKFNGGVLKNGVFSSDKFFVDSDNVCFDNIQFAGDCIFQNFQSKWFIKPILKRIAPDQEAETNPVVDVTDKLQALLDSNLRTITINTGWYYITDTLVVDSDLDLHTEIDDDLSADFIYNDKQLAKTVIYSDVVQTLFVYNMYTDRQKVGINIGAITFICETPFTSLAEGDYVDEYNNPHSQDSYTLDDMKDAIDIPIALIATPYEGNVIWEGVVKASCIGPKSRVVRWEDNEIIDNRLTWSMTGLKLHADKSSIYLLRFYGHMTYVYNSYATKISEGQVMTGLTIYGYTRAVFGLQTDSDILVYGKHQALSTPYLNRGNGYFATTSLIGYYAHVFDVAKLDTRRPLYVANKEFSCKGVNLRSNRVNLDYQGGYGGEPFEDGLVVNYDGLKSYKNILSLVPSVEANIKSDGVFTFSATYQEDINSIPVSLFSMDDIYNIDQLFYNGISYQGKGGEAAIRYEQVARFKEQKEGILKYSFQIKNLLNQSELPTFLLVSSRRAATQISVSLFDDSNGTAANAYLTKQFSGNSYETTDIAMLISDASLAPLNPTTLRVEIEFNGIFNALPYVSIPTTKHLVESNSLNDNFRLPLIPVGQRVGFTYYDSVLKQNITWDGEKWIEKNGEEVGVYNNCLKFTAVNDDSAVALEAVGSPESLNISLHYSFDEGKHWKAYSIGESLDLQSHESVLFKGENSCYAYDQSNYYHFVFEGQFHASGDITSLLNDGIGGNVELKSKNNYAFYKLFYGCVGLLSAPNMPSTTLSANCYRSMYEGCSSLSNNQLLPATTLGQFCFDAMYKDCVSLKTAQILCENPNQKYCCRNMFNGCTAIETITTRFYDTPIVNADIVTLGWIDNIDNDNTHTIECYPFLELQSGVNGIQSNWNRIDLLTDIVTISTNFTNIETIVEKTSEIGKSILLQLEAADDFELDASSVIVEMGDIDITKLVFDGVDVIYIPSITGNVKITAIATAISNPI